MIISPNGGYASVKDLEYVRYVIDMNTGATVFSFEEDDFSYFTFDGEKGFVFKRADDNYFYFDFESGTETDLGVSKAFLYSNINGEGYATRNGESFVLYKGSEQVWNLNYSSEGFSDESRLEIAVNFIPGSDECWVFITDYDNRVTNAFVIDMLNGSSSKIFIANTVCFDIATDGKNIVWKDIEEYNYSLWIMDINSGTVKSRYVNDSYRLVVLNDYVVTITDGSVSILDKDLNDVDQFEASGYIRAFVFSDELVLLDGSGMMYKIRDGRYTCYDTGLSNEYLSWMQEYRDGKLYAAQTGDNHIYTYTFRQSDYMVVTSGDYEDLMSDYYDIIQIHEDPDVSDFVDLVMQNETEFQENRIIRVVMCHNAELGLIQLYDGAVFIYDSSTGEKIKTIYSLESFVNMFYYDEQSGYYYLSSNNVDVYDSNFKNIYSIRNCILSGIEKQSGAIVVLDLTYSDPNNFSGHYTVCPVTYDQLISLTDDYLSGYEPDERVKEKYSLG